ncbi:hypothetical protein [Nocardia sp. NBC_00416]|uniref:hypothetical protein n=1 Tax=Nocardia sp. NBC_00416 TaxID=2975991 RepID=UPI002E1CB6EC
MRLSVSGATGGTGGGAARRVAAAGRHVTAVVYDPAGLTTREHPRLEVVTAVGHSVSVVCS